MPLLIKVIYPFNLTVDKTKAIEIGAKGTLNNTTLKLKILSERYTQQSLTTISLQNCDYSKELFWDKLGH